MATGKHYNIAAVREAADIVQVVGETVNLRRVGPGRWVAVCPFHTEKTPSFTVSRLRRRFHCFGCGASGDVLDYTMRLHGVTLRDALAMLAVRVGVPSEQRWTAAESKRYTSAAQQAPQLAQQLADFALGLEIAAERNLKRNDVPGQASETLAREHSQLHAIRQATVLEIAALWRRTNPQTRQYIEGIGRENRQDAERIAHLIVDMLTVKAFTEAG